MPPLAEHHQCEPYEWQCANKRCIPESWQCDMEDDCDDNSDEDSSHCANRTCRPGYFKCANGHCIPQTWKCDVDNDCGDYSDEPLQECCEFCVQVWPESSSVWLERVHGPCCSPVACTLFALPKNAEESRMLSLQLEPHPWVSNGGFLVSAHGMSNYRI